LAQVRLQHISETDVIAIVSGKSSIADCSEWERMHQRRWDRLLRWDRTTESTLPA